MTTHIVELLQTSLQCINPLIIQNANVQSSDMHKTSMFKITDPHEYSKNPVNHIPLLLRKQLKGILHRNTQQYGKYHLRRTWL